MQVLHSENHFDLTILEHQVQSLARVSRIQWHIDPAGFQDRQHADDHLQSLLKSNPDANLWTNPQITQVIRELICA